MSCRAYQSMKSIDNTLGRICHKVLLANSQQTLDLLQVLSLGLVIEHMSLLACENA